MFIKFSNKKSTVKKNSPCLQKKLNFFNLFIYFSSHIEIDILFIYLLPLLVRARWVCFSFIPGGGLLSTIITFTAKLSTSERSLNRLNNIVTLFYVIIELARAGQKSSQHLYLMNFMSVSHKNRTHIIKIDRKGKKKKKQ